MGPQAGPAPAEAPPPPAAFSGPRHAADMLFDPSAMAGAREDLRVEQGGATNYRVMVDQLEARIHDGQDGYLWDAQGWYGGDLDKLWIKSEGGGSFGEETEERSEEHTSELQSLMRISSAVFRLNKKNTKSTRQTTDNKYHLRSLP